MKELMTRLGYSFKDSALLEMALSHRSYSPSSYERLEFLGDSILNFVITEFLYHHYPNVAEGELSRMRALLVNGETLASLAKELQIGNNVRLGSSELRSGGKERRSILADALESIVGAIYLDAGFERCRSCILQWWEGRLNSLSTLKVTKDPKSLLQEWSQANKMSLPIYEVEKIEGQAHNQIFSVSCRIAGLPSVTKGQSTSRRHAERQAAELYLKNIEQWVSHHDKEN